MTYKLVTNLDEIKKEYACTQTDYSSANHVIGATRRYNTEKKLLSGPCMDHCRVCLTRNAIKKSLGNMHTPNSTQK